jgi:predicted enzyme related to lactoylglutathione lyase
MKVTEHRPGAPSWVHVATPDLAATTAFYTALFGWTVDEFSIFRLDGIPVAALRAADLPAWTWYAATTDAGETARKVEAAGGKVVTATAFLDPNGTPFSVWEAGTVPGAGVVDEPGAHVYTELLTRDPDAAAEFYGRTLDWTPVFNGNPDKPYTQFQLGGRTVAGMMPMKGEAWPADLPDHWMVYFGVADCDAAVERLRRLGGSVSVPPMEVPGHGRFAVVGDPTGAYFSVITMADW